MSQLFPDCDAILKHYVEYPIRPELENMYGVCNLTCCRSVRKYWNPTLTRATSPPICFAPFNCSPIHLCNLQGLGTSVFTKIHQPIPCQRRTAQQYTLRCRCFCMCSELHKTWYYHHPSWIYSLEVYRLPFFNGHNREQCRSGHIFEKQFNNNTPCTLLVHLTFYLQNTLEWSIWLVDVLSHDMWTSTAWPPRISNNV